MKESKAPIQFTAKEMQNFIREGLEKKDHALLEDLFSRMGLSESPNIHGKTLATAHQKPLLLALTKLKASLGDNHFSLLLKSVKLDLDQHSLGNLRLLELLPEALDLPKEDFTPQETFNKIYGLLALREQLNGLKIIEANSGKESSPKLRKIEQSLQIVVPGDGGHDLSRAEKIEALKALGLPRAEEKKETDYAAVLEKTSKRFKNLRQKDLQTLEVKNKASQWPSFGSVVKAALVFAGLSRIAPAAGINPPTNAPVASPTTRAPSRLPSLIPSNEPSRSPSYLQTTTPSQFPSLTPLDQNSQSPSNTPTESPSHFPSLMPSSQTSLSPSKNPSLAPSELPTLNPTIFPSLEPSRTPTSQPTLFPTEIPTVTPSPRPSIYPSISPSFVPTSSSMQFSVPSQSPTNAPTLYNETPSQLPTKIPSRVPSIAPSKSPSQLPTGSPTFYNVTTPPSNAPTIIPTNPDGTLAPTSLVPTFSPTGEPTGNYTSVPTEEVLSNSPTLQSVVTTSPTGEVTNSPTVPAPFVTGAPISAAPTERPTTFVPTSAPTRVQDNVSNSLNFALIGGAGGGGLALIGAVVAVVCCCRRKKEQVEHAVDNGVEMQENPMSNLKVSTPEQDVELFLEKLKTTSDDFIYYLENKDDKILKKFDSALSDNADWKSFLITQRNLRTDDGYPLVTSQSELCQYDNDLFNKYSDAGLDIGAVAAEAFDRRDFSTTEISVSIYSLSRPNKPSSRSSEDSPNSSSKSITNLRPPNSWSSNLRKHEQLIFGDNYDLESSVSESSVSESSVFESSLYPSSASVSPSASSNLLKEGPKNPAPGRDQ